MTLTWIGIVVMVIVFVGWVWYENHRLTTFAETGMRARPGRRDAAPPQPGQT